MWGARSPKDHHLAMLLRPLFLKSFRFFEIISCTHLIVIIFSSSLLKSIVVPMYVPAGNAEINICELTAMLSNFKFPWKNCLLIDWHERIKGGVLGVNSTEFFFNFLGFYIKKCHKFWACPEIFRVGRGGGVWILLIDGEI